MAIRINYEAVMRQAEQMRHLTDDMGYELYKYDEAMAQLAEGWDGPAFQVCKKKMEILRKKINVTKRKMQDTAELIEKTAVRIHRADMEAEEKIRQL